MAHPAQSTALDGAQRSFWFVHNVDGRQIVCGTNGYSLLANVQAAIREQLASSGPLSSIGGTIRAEEIPSIQTPYYGDVPLPQSFSGWDTTTLRGLYALAQRYRASRSTLAAIEADSRLPSGSSLSAATIQYAIWLTYYSRGVRDVTQPDGTVVTTSVFGLGSPAQVALATSPRTIYPVKGVNPPVPSDGVVDTQLICAPPAVAVPTESPITVTTTFTPNVPLIVAVLAATALGAVILTKRAPRLVQIRGRLYEERRVYRK